MKAKQFEMRKNTYKTPKKSKTGEITGRRFISRNVADAMQWIAVNPKKYPVCSHEDVNHASGVAIAAFATTVALDQLKRIRQLFDVVRGELSIEVDFTRNKLEEHMSLLLAAKSVLSSADISQAREKSAPTNALALAIRKTPQGKDILNQVSEIQNEFRRDILPIVEESLFIESKQTSKKLSAKIQRLMKLMAFRLHALIYNLDDTIEKTKSLRESIIADWHLDIAQVWKHPDYRPVAEKQTDGIRSQDAKSKGKRKKSKG